MIKTKSLESEINRLKARVKDLEEKLEKAETIINSPENISDREFMEALYIKAKEIIAKNNYHASPIFLQKKLLIDFPRAKKMFNKLQSDGILIN